MAFVPDIPVIVAVVCSGLCGAFALPVVFNRVRRLIHHSRLQAKVLGSDEVKDKDKDKEAFLAGLYRNGIAFLRPMARFALTVPWIRSQCAYCAQALRIKGYVTDTTYICESLLAMTASATLFSFLLTKNLIISLALAIMSAIIVSGRAKKTLEQGEIRLIEQIPDVLRSFGICFNAGYSLQQAFEQTAQETPAPLGMELRQASYDVNAGRSIEEALTALEKRTRAGELRFAIVALEIQHRTGGSLAELLENAAEAVVASCDLRRQLSVQTAQARLSAKVVTILPLVLVGILSLTIDGYLETFFSSSEGLAILFLALGMEALGVFAIRRILGVDLG